MRTDLPALSPSRLGQHRGRSLAVGIVVALALTAILPTPASADVGLTIIERCTKHQSVAGYSVTDYQRALNEMSAFLTEYSDCSELITKAELAAAGGGTGSGTAALLSHQEITPTPAERHLIEQAKSGPAPLRIGDRMLLPGVVHANIASAASKLPISLLAMIVFVLGGLVVIAGREIAKRIARLRQS